MYQSYKKYSRLWFAATASSIPFVNYNLTFFITTVFAQRVTLEENKKTAHKGKLGDLNPR